MNEDGTIIAIGETGFSENLVSEGRVKIVKYNGVFWEPLGQPILGGENYDDEGYSELGYEIAMNYAGTRVVVSDWNNQKGWMHQVGVRVFELQGDVWVQLGNSFEGSPQTEPGGPRKHLVISLLWMPLVTSDNF